MAALPHTTESKAEAQYMRCVPFQISEEGTLLESRASLSVRLVVKHGAEPFLKKLIIPQGFKKLSAFVEYDLSMCPQEPTAVFP
jgi:hypothetical protein